MDFFMHAVMFNLYKALQMLIEPHLLKPENLRVAIALYLQAPISRGKVNVNPLFLKVPPNPSIFLYPLVLLKPHGFIDFYKSFI